jgi:hypothetical protein
MVNCYRTDELYLSVCVFIVFLCDNAFEDNVLESITHDTLADITNQSIPMTLTKKTQQDKKIILQTKICCPRFVYDVHRGHVQYEHVRSDGYCVAGLQKS